jgi:ankyrin repeat protein
MDGIEDLVSVLVEKGWTIILQTAKDASPLHLAAGKRDMNMIRVLLKHGADCHSANDHGETPMFWALCGPSWACHGLLLSAGANSDHLTVDKNLALHYAIGSREPVDLSIIQAMIVQSMDLDTANKDGITPLHLAAFYNYSGITSLLLKRGAKPNISPRLPMLIAAVMYGAPNVQVIRHLLDAGAYADVYDELGTSFLAWVILTGSLYIFSIITAHLPIEWLARELPVISAVVESDEKRVIDDLHLCRLSCLAQAYAITRVKKTQNGPSDEVHQPNVPVALPAWLPSEERFPAMLFARSICGTEGSKSTLKRAKERCVDDYGISP